MCIFYVFICFVLCVSCYFWVCLCHYITCTGFSFPADKKPLSHRACWRDCPVDCQLGEWENWSPCSRSCGDGGFHVRMREVLRPPAHGGQPCDARYQTKECEPVECAWWRTGIPSLITSVLFYIIEWNEWFFKRTIQCMMSDFFVSKWKWKAGVITL